MRKPTRTDLLASKNLNDGLDLDFGETASAPPQDTWSEWQTLLSQAPAMSYLVAALAASLQAERGLGNDAAGSHPSADNDWAFDGAFAPEAMARGGGKGGGKTTGGGTGTTSGSTDTGTTTTTTTSSGTSKFIWPTLNPPTGDATLPTDTYFSQQWSLISPTAGIHVTNAWQNYTGRGIKVGVIDDGIDYSHPDLKPNYLFNLDYDATNGGSNAYGTSTNSHGTTVAGVIGAARDGSGVVGIAYEAGIAGFRISYTTGGQSQLADAFNKVLSNGMDVVNASWGYSTPYVDNFDGSFSSSRTAIENDVANGRGGLGINIVFAAGNGRASGDNVNYHNYQNSPYVITVAATGLNGQVITSFSNPGAALLVSAPGSSIKTDDRLGSDGCSTGDYVSMSGTSYAAPAISGVIALMLQANPNLGYRDVMEILAYSARNPDPANAGWQTNGAHNWNGGGLHFSHDYGFGLVDATAAVRLAESWMTQSTFANLLTQSVSHVDNARIPDGAGSLTSQISLTTSEILDKIVVDLDISHARPSDLTVTLTSPHGTTAVLVARPANGTGTGIVFETSANNFWGEDANGTWTLTVTDSVSGSVGTLNGWTLHGLGDSASNPVVYIYTDEFATAAGADRAVLHDTSGTAVINTAAVTTGVTLDLHAGAFSTVAGKSLQIASDTVIRFAWAGDGNDTIVANDWGDTIQTGRGNDKIVAGGGADLLYGGPGDDLFVFETLAQTADLIGDFTPGADVIDLHQLLIAVGYNGSDAVADGWLTLVENSSGGTDFLIDPHNGLAAVTVFGVAQVTPGLLQNGVDYWTTLYV